MTTNNDIDWDQHRYATLQLQADLGIVLPAWALADRACEAVAAMEADE